MDKEMMAKVEEFVKEYSKRELNMEEMEQVVGGELGGLFLDGRYTPKEDVYNMFLNMADMSQVSHRLKLTFQLLDQMTVFQCI